MRDPLEFPEKVEITSNILLKKSRNSCICRWIVKGICVWIDEVLLQFYYLSIRALGFGPGSTDYLTKSGRGRNPPAHSQRSPSHLSFRQRPSKYSNLLESHPQPCMEWWISSVLMQDICKVHKGTPNVGWNSFISSLISFISSGWVQVTVTGETDLPSQTWICSRMTGKNKTQNKKTNSKCLKLKMS